MTMTEMESEKQITFVWLHQSHSCPCFNLGNSTHVITVFFKRVHKQKAGPG